MIEITRKPYSTDLTDRQWEAISPLFINTRNCKRPQRELVNAVLYVVDYGIKWRNLPHDFPPWETVSSFCCRAIKSGLWDEILQFLVEITGQIEERDANPTYAIIDSQSVKTIGADKERGIDGGKKIKGRKRHIVVEALGNILAVVVHAANIHDTKSGILPATEAVANCPTIRKFCADAGYRGTFVDEMRDKFLLDADVVKRSDLGKWEILPKRWIVERTFARLSNYRKLSKDHEINVLSAEFLIKFAISCKLLKRL